MSHIYITNNGSVMGVKGGRFIVRKKEEMVTSIPRETVESVSVFGNSTITTNCMQELLKENIPVCFYSSNGKYFGRLQSTSGCKINLMCKQFRTFEEKNFILGMAGKITFAKINNQIVFMNRCERSSGRKFIDLISKAKYMKSKTVSATIIEELMGYEGMAAKCYFELIRNIIKPEFKFTGRNRRPPLDPFNSLLSFGYTLLLYEIYSKVETVGLNPYLGFLHKARDNHPALVSDLMEEWRTIIVDSLVVHMIQANEINYDDFVHDNDVRGIYLTNSAMRKFITRFEKKLNTKMKYLSYDDKERSFRDAIYIQCKKLCCAINEEDFSIYMPMLLR